ncbi:ParA family protein, partial [Phocaeicola dorei]
MSQNQSILEMIQTPVIVTFANQKGGVGKTTLCVT